MHVTGAGVSATSSSDRVEDFRIEEDEATNGDARVVTLFGEVDLHVAATLRERLDKVVGVSGIDLVVDMSRVSFLDSMALGVLLGTLKQLRAEGRELRLVVPGSKLRRIFEITLLDQVFTLAGSRQEALATLES